MAFGASRHEKHGFCPEFHSIEPPLFGIDGYCVLHRNVGTLMIPSLDEHRRYCTTCDFPSCPNRLARTARES